MEARLMLLCARLGRRAMGACAVLAAVSFTSLPAAAVGSGGPLDAGAVAGCYAYDADNERFLPAAVAKQGESPAMGTSRVAGYGRICDYDDPASFVRTIAHRQANRFAPNTRPSYGNWGGEFLDDAIRSPVVRPDLANVSSKIQRQMGTRGWTPDLIDEAVLQGRGYPAVNKFGGANTPATRYVHPQTRQSVVIDNATGEVIHVGGPGFRY